MVDIIIAIVLHSTFASDFWLTSMLLYLPVVPVSRCRYQLNVFLPQSFKSLSFMENNGLPWNCTPKFDIPRFTEIYDAIIHMISSTVVLPIHLESTSHRSLTRALSSTAYQHRA